MPGIVAVPAAVVAGAVAGIAALGLDAGSGTALAIGGTTFALTLVAFVAYAERTIAAYRRDTVVRFPTPHAESPVRRR